ncbi:MAG: GxGYxYP family putative glycoside hydrolase [Armatimonadota bacterium]|nr:GxGYxYP family putative glycoside hydrolase [Armatimonadota bacterium]
MLTRIGFMLIMAAVLLLPRTTIAAGSPDIVARRRALAAEKPYTSVAPRSKEPVGELTLLRVWPDDESLRMALASLQGIVNREQPRIYIGVDKVMNWMEYHSGKVWMDKVESDPYRIFEKFKDHAKGLVIYDSTEGCANIAVMYAGLEDLLPVNPELAEKLSAKFGWKVVHDLRGRWKNRMEAFQWAYENLLPRCTKFALMHYDFTHGENEMGTFRFEAPAPSYTGFSTDYPVEFKMFVWFIGSEPQPGELELAGKILESVPFNTPVFGACGGSMYMEPVLVCFVASYADIYVPFGGTPNVSLLSGVRVPEKVLKQKPLPVRDLGPEKIYVAFTNSEHDNLEHVIGGGPAWHRLGFETDDPNRIWWCDPLRGKLPIGWPIGPLLSELAPTTLARLMTTATENDYFMAALTGMGLTSLQDFASVYPEDQEELVAEYGKLTSRYMKRLGWTMVNPWGPPGSLRTFMKNIPGLQGALEGYGMRSGMTYEKANYLLEGVPVMHSLTGGVSGATRSRSINDDYKRRSEILTKQITDVKVEGRPGFIHAWTIGWDFGPTVLKMAVDKLPPEYVIVRPDELVTLFKKYKGSKAELRSTSPKIKASGVVTETPAGESGLIIDTGKIKVEIGWGNEPQTPIRRIMGVDGKWRGGGTLLTHNPKKMSVTSFVCERTKTSDKEREYLLAYTYNDGGHLKIRVRAFAGRPFVVIEEECDKAHLPSWSINVYPDFQPDVLVRDTHETPIVYRGDETFGGPPDCGWALAGKKDNRDLIGLYTISWGDWNSGDVVMWRRPESAYFEFYHQKAGTKKFAVAALDRNDSGAPKRIWRELNGVAGR